MSVLLLGGRWPVVCCRMSEVPGRPPRCLAESHSASRACRGRGPGSCAEGTGGCHARHGHAVPTCPGDPCAQSTFGQLTLSHHHGAAILHWKAAMLQLWLDLPDRRPRPLQVRGLQPPYVPAVLLGGRRPGHRLLHRLLGRVEPERWARRARRPCTCRCLDAQLTRGTLASDGQLTRGHVPVEPRLALCLAFVKRPQTYTSTTITVMPPP